MDTNKSRSSVVTPQERMLRQHGVPLEDIATLERALGVPPELNGPRRALTWGLSIAPWSALHPLLARWVATTIASGALDDARPAEWARAVLREDPDPELADRAVRELESLIETLCRCRGVANEAHGAHETDMDKVPADLQAWLLCLAAAKAAARAARPLDDGVWKPVRTAWEWRQAATPAELRSEDLDQHLVEVIGAAAAFVRSWSFARGNTSIVPVAGLA